MYYGHLRNPDFIPKIVDIQHAGRGYKARLINEKTGFDKYISFTELNKLLNNVMAYRVSSGIANYIEGNNVSSIPLLNRVKYDIQYGNCVVE